MSPEEAETQRACAVVGELVLLASALDHQLNLICMLLLGLPEAPMTEPVLASLDSSRKLEILKAWSSKISAPAWKKGLLDHVRALESINRERNTAAHSVMRFEGGKAVLFSPAAARLIKSIDLSTRTAETVPLERLRAAIAGAQDALRSGEMLRQNLERFAAERSRRAEIPAAGHTPASVPLAFERLIHADWSIDARKRWQATARRTDSGWLVEAAQPVGPMQAFVDDLLRQDVRTLAGFDFPIGVPAAYGRLTGLSDFPTLLATIGAGDWSSFYDVADLPEQISVRRPFYPRRSSAGSSPQHLVERLGLAGRDELYRVCERARDGRAAGSPLFWTLGGKQVGKAALAGWREVIRPAVARRARLWPFDGELGDLAAAPGLVLAETYPAEAYGHVGVRLAGAGGGKQSQGARIRAGEAVQVWAERASVQLTPGARDQMQGGFGPEMSGEDPFDAMMGLLGMIEVADGRRAAAPALSPEQQIWEGWILGQRR